MGCATSKIDDLPLVSLCKQRKTLIKSALDHRFSLAAAHLAYFRHLRLIGDSLCRFVEEELTVADAASSSISSMSSPVLTLPSSDKNGKGKGEEEGNSHLHWSDDDEYDDGHFEIDEDSSHEEVKKKKNKRSIENDKGDGNRKKVIMPPQPGISYIPPSSSNYPYSFGNSYYPSPPMNSYGNSDNPSYYSNYYPENNDHLYGSSSTSYTTYYMNNLVTPIPSVIYHEPKQNQIYSYSNYSNSDANRNENYSTSPPNNGSGLSEQKWWPPTPPSPKVSAWESFNPFQAFAGGGGVYPDYYSRDANGYGSNTSSPDSKEVREREGIPDLEKETDSEVIKDVFNNTKKHADFTFHKSKGKKVQFVDENISNSKKNNQFGEGTSKGMPMHNQLEKSEPASTLKAGPMEARDVKSSSPDSITTISTSLDQVSMKNKGVTFGMDNAHLGIESSKTSSLSAHGSRDLSEIVTEIKEEFEAASDYGKEVSVLLEVDKAPYKSQSTFMKVMLATICFTPISASDASAGLAEGYLGGSEDGLYSRSLATTLEKMHVWEKKLYKEVKDEERLRVFYEKQCKRLKNLYERGAGDSKVEAIQTSIRKLLTKINVSVRAADSISNRIHKLRDEELEPQLKELIYGLRKMLKLMLKCHQKQFQAILESKTRALKANTCLRKDSNVRATIQLEAELLKWSHHFSNWVETQKSYAATLNSWLQKCLHYEPEITLDGEVPYSPGKIGAPLVFIMCHDWNQAMERISDSEVQTAMKNFATNLHQLWERQDEEQNRRLKAENTYKDFEKQIRAITPHDGVTVDLDTMRQRVKEERLGHKEVVKLVHDAVSQSIQAGLVPIFEALENFTSEASKAFNDVRLEP